MAPLFLPSPLCLFCVFPKLSLKVATTRENLRKVECYKKSSLVLERKHEAEEEEEEEEEEKEIEDEGEARGKNQGCCHCPVENEPTRNWVEGRDGRTIESLLFILF